MKKLLTTCALVALGGLTVFAAAKTKDVTGTIESNPKKKTMFNIKTEDGETIKTYAWKKMQARLKKIQDKDKKATFSIFKNKHGHYVIQNFKAE